MPKVLVYHYRHKDTKDTKPVIPDGLAVITTSELDEILHKRKYTSEVLERFRDLTLTKLHYRSGTAAQH